MEVTRKTRVMNVMADGDMRDVLAWYGLPLDDRRYFRVSLEAFCDAHDVDVEDVLVELSLAEADAGSDDDDEWGEAYAPWLLHA